MIDRDSYFLYEMYRQVLFNEASLKPITLPKEELIGKSVDIHPVVSPNPDEDDYMRWSVKLKGLVIGYAETIHIKDCFTDIKHHLINASIRSKVLGKGQKAPVILLRGIVMDVDFPVSDIKRRTAGFDSVTYNPHKHDEYLYANCLPDWWHKDERFWDVPKGERPAKVPIRQQGMSEREQKYEEKCEVSRKVSEQLSYFKCEESILKQHNIRGEDYMWVKGVYY